MPAYRDGQELANRVTIASSLVSRTCRVSDRSIRSFFEGGLRDELSAPRMVWTSPGADAPTIAAAGSAITIIGHGSDRFRAVQDAASSVFIDRDVPSGTPAAARPRLLGGFAFHADHTGSRPWDGFESACFVLPRIQLTHTGTGTYLTVNAHGPDADPATVEATLENARTTIETDADLRPTSPPGVTALERTTTKETWREQVATALARIDEGTLRKVVLAQAIHAKLDRHLDPIATLARLDEGYPDCYRFLVAPSDDAAFFGATPERLVSLQGRTVETGALAGSVGRGDTPVEDETLETELRESNKDQHEHALVLETIRDQLKPLAASVTTGDQRIRRLASVQHLQTPIRARLSEETHVLSLAESLHPTPAVGGLPPAAAHDTIREVESFDRGWYAGPVGWFDARGNGTFAVAIRSAVGAGRSATLFAGAGIVGDSDPDEEWEEVQLKYRPILDALEP